MGSGTPPKPDLRKRERVILDTSIRVLREGQSPTLGRTHDLSSGGMSIYAPLELTQGDVIRLSFTLPNSRTQFEVSAVVKNRNGFRYGIEFADLTALESAEIQRVTGILALMQS